jgi:hypothetical protein
VQASIHRGRAVGALASLVEVSQRFAAAG